MFRVWAAVVLFVLSAATDTPQGVADLLKQTLDSRSSESKADDPRAAIFRAAERI